MPKGQTKFSKYETALIKANKTLQKAVSRIAQAAAELEARPDPKPKSPKTAVRQLKLPGTVGGRKAAKTPAKRKRA